MDEFKKLRVEENITLKEMAEKLGISESLYQKLEYGIRQPSVKVLKKLKEAFPDIDINIFLK